MEYTALAEELLTAMSSLPQVKAERKMSKRMKGQRFVLTYLAANKNTAYPKNLSSSMMVSTARIAVILNQLEEEGMITRSIDENDNRQVIVRLTPKGSEAAAAYRQDTLNSISRMLEYLGPEDAEAYVRIRKKLMHMDWYKE